MVILTGHSRDHADQDAAVEVLLTSGSPPFGRVALRVKGMDATRGTATGSATATATRTGIRVGVSLGLESVHDAPGLVAGIPPSPAGSAADTTARA